MNILIFLNQTSSSHLHTKAYYFEDHANWQLVCNHNWKVCDFRGYPMYDWVWHIRASDDPWTGPPGNRCPSNATSSSPHYIPIWVGFEHILTVWTPILKLLPSYRGVQSLSKTIAVPWPDHRGWPCPSWSHFEILRSFEQKDDFLLGSSILFLEGSPATWLTNPATYHCHFWGPLNRQFRMHKLERAALCLWVSNRCAWGMLMPGKALRSVRFSAQTSS